MEQIGQKLKITFEKNKKPQTEANSERANVIEQVIALMGEKDNRRFKYWLGRTRRLSPGDIFGLIKQAGEGKNPPALFNWLLKQKLSTPTPYSQTPKAGV